MLRPTCLKYSIVIFFIFFPITANCQLSDPGDTIYVANWNVENLFDIMDDPKINDSEFLPNGSKEWDEEKLDKKLHNLVRVINYMNNGCGPDILGFQEVENINVLKLLTYKVPGRDYIIAHRDSPDERGIDVSLIYDRTIFDIVDLVPIRVTIPTGYNTRDILHVTLLHKLSKAKLHVFVNHWPSRRGGEEKSEPNRIAVAKYLRSEVDSLLKSPDDSHIIILGDFNDEPNNKSVEEILNAKDMECMDETFPENILYNLSYKKFTENHGSYLYRTGWNMIDQIIVSKSLSDGKYLDYKCGSFEVVKPDFMLNREGDRNGGPMPTFAGSKYIGGYSDHFPVAAKFYNKN